MQKEVLPSHKLQDHAYESSHRFVSHTARISQIFVKQSVRELCDSKLSGLHAFENMAIIHEV